MTKDELLELGIKKRNKEIDLSWEELAQKYSNGRFKSGEAFRCWVKKQLHKNKNKLEIHNDKQDNDIFTEESFEIKSNGEQVSKKFIKMTNEDAKNPHFLLKAHGYNPDEWELVNAKNKIWNTYSKQDGIKTLYASSITVKPKQKEQSFEKLIEKLIDNIKTVKPIVVDRCFTHTDDKRMLEIPLFDPHFGISDYEYYKPTQDKIISFLLSRYWDEVLFIIGQDTFHNDDFRGRTAKGTQIQQVDMVQAWEDCRKFYEPLIEIALSQSYNVKIMYSKGNHDETISWAFVQFLKARFPQAVFDDKFEERKVHVYGNNFIGVTHGDKARNNLHNIFPIEFPEQWSKATNREIHIGHFHIEDAKDKFGMMIRTLATRNKTDQWHKDNGFVGGHKRFMLFEFSREALESIHYV